MICVVYSQNINKDYSNTTFYIIHFYENNRNILGGFLYNALLLLEITYIPVTSISIK